MDSFKRTSKMDEIFSFDSSTETKTLQDMFDMEKDNVKQIAEFRKKINDEIVKEQERKLKRSYVKIQEEITQARLDGVKDIVSLEEKLKKKAIKDEYEDRMARMKKLYEEELKAAKKKGTKETVSEINKAYEALDESLRLAKIMLDKGDITSDEYAKKKQDIENKQNELNAQSATKQVMQGLINALQGLSDSVNSNMKTYTELQKGTNARLQGKQLGAGWRAAGLLAGKNPMDTFGIMESRLSLAVGINPYFRTETMLTNLSNLINEGISSNVEQRAFLQTASENIANTFDVANGALLRIIRLQQQDSTAARLGMEAYLTRFLNSLVDNTEYLNQTFDNVQEALVETSSHMSVQAATELEYVIQKWLGSLVGVGMSDTTATNIAQALGYLGSGNVDALSSSNLQNLLVMAASRSNLSYSDLLTQGLNATNADLLLNNLVAYMVEIEKSGNNVVKSQFANTFGISYSDLAAAANLAPSMKSIYGNTKSFSDMYGELAYQLTMVPLRMSMSTMFDNLWENLEFGLGKNIASSPALAAMWKVTDLIQQNTGGINIPFVNAMGFGLDMNTTVENLVKLGIVGISSLGMIGDAISGLVTSVAPASTLLKLGILPNNTTISRGSGLGSYSSGLSTSQSSVQTVGQGSGESIKEGALAGAKSEAQQESGSSAEEEEEMKKANVNIYKYLTETFDNKMDRLLGYIDGVESKLDDIERKMISAGGPS